MIFPAKISWQALRKPVIIRLSANRSKHLISASVTTTFRHLYLTISLIQVNALSLLIHDKPATSFRFWLTVVNAQLVLCIMCVSASCAVCVGNTSVLQLNA